MINITKKIGEGGERDRGIPQATSGVGKKKKSENETGQGGG